MRFPRSMHVETCLLNSMSNVWVSERQVLESTSIATVLCGISEKRTLCGRKFAAHINGSGAGVALDHASTLQELNGILALRKDHARRRPSDRDPEKEGQGAKICHGELGVKPLRELLKKKVGRGGDDDVVHIEKYVGVLLSMAIDEERDILLGGDEAKPVGEVGKSLVPGPWSLFEAIEGLVQTTHIVRTPGVNEARRLLTIDLLVKVAMKKGILDVELVNRP
jgi:hypothetical protein